MKNFCILVLVLILVASLVSCASPATPDQTGPQSDTNKADPSDVEVDGQVTIVYMTQAGMPKIMFELIEEFEAHNKDIKVQINEVAAEETYDQLVLTTNAGTAPDVYMTFWTIDAATNGLAAELNEFIDPVEFESRFTPAAQGYGEWAGGIYAIPFRSGASVMFANKTLFDEAEIDLPYSGWTWDEFLTVAEQLTDEAKGVYGFSICGDAGDSGTDWQFWPFLLQAGGNVLNENNEAIFNSEEGVAALEFLVEMIESNIIPPGVASTNVNQQGDLMSSGKLALFQDGPWFLGAMQEKSEGNFEIVALPMPVGRKSGSIAGGTALAMSKDSKNKEQAYRFIEFMTSDDSLGRWCEEFKQVSPLTNTPDTAYYKNDDYKVFAGQQADPGTIVANYYPNSTELNAIMRNYLQAAYLGQMTPKQALDAAAEEWNLILSDY